MSSKDPEWPKWCSICDVKLISPATEASHYGGKKHKSRLGTPTKKQPSSTQCDNNTSATADHPNGSTKKVEDVENNEEEIHAIVQGILSNSSAKNDIIQQVKEILTLDQQKGGCSHSFENEQESSNKKMKEYISSIDERTVFKVKRNFSHEMESVRRKTEKSQKQSILQTEAVQQLGRNLDEKHQPEEKEEKWSDIHIFYDDVDRFICEANIRQQCRYGPSKCNKHHYPLPYVWQIMLDGIWETTTENNSIEAAFCDVNRNCYIYFMDWNGSIREITIDFATMSCTDSDMFSFPVRRLSTESYMEVSKRHEYHTAWIWYWQDDGHQWIPYEVESPPYQDVAEAKYIANERYCLFEVRRFQYLLDMVAMTQTNLKTGRSRCVRRRPHLDGYSPNILPVQHFNKSLMPLHLGWAPMNTTAYSNPDLVLLPVNSKQYEMVQNRFFETMSRYEYQINHIIRIQNLALWERYDRKKRILQQCSHLKGNLNERQLFHGTSSEDIAYCICKEGFDWRVCGKNGTVYGNGSYFAKDARYSHSYTSRSSSEVKLMFLSLVLLGKYAPGKQGLTRPPLLDESRVDGGCYNSCVDNVNDPSIYIVFHDDQSYPEYLIEYKSKYDKLDELLLRSSHKSQTEMRYSIRKTHPATTRQTTVFPRVARVTSYIPPPSPIPPKAATSMTAAAAADRATAGSNASFYKIGQQPLLNDLQQYGTHITSLQLASTDIQQGYTEPHVAEQEKETVTLQNNSCIVL